VSNSVLFAWRRGKSTLSQFAERASNKRHTKYIYRACGVCKAGCTEEMQQTYGRKYKRKKMSVDHAKAAGCCRPNTAQPSMLATVINHAEKRTTQAKTACGQRCDGLMLALTRF
jgi:hypothetical protein